jgi:hypothetical protein
MAYPTVSAPYGLKPVNLIGGQLFAGSTRNLPIQYGYASNLYYGDIVQLVRGFVVQSTITSSNGETTPGSTAPTDAIVGVFLGCSFTNPVTKQKTFSQYWPASTLAGDAVAIVADDPDQVFKMVMIQNGTTLGSAAIPMIGQNIQLSRLWQAGTGSAVAGNANTGNSYLAALATTLGTTAQVPLRVVGVQTDTAYAVSATGSSSSTTITLTGSGLPSAISYGADVAYLAPNGQLIETGSFVTAGLTAGTTSITINAAIAVPGSVTAIPSGSTIVFTNAPEVLVKFNQGTHGYYYPVAV